MNRIVLPEMLDALPALDAAALRSRRDIRRLNAIMRHPQIMAQALRENAPGVHARNIVELGAGDGLFLLDVARQLDGGWRGAEARLVDRLDTLEPETRDEFRRLGWNTRLEISDAPRWLRHNHEDLQIVISNLFVHQFKDEPLAEMLRLAAHSSHLVVALEPHRAWLPRLAGQFLWLAGCGPVTRYDAPVSIRAGFRAGELTALWPDKKNWSLTERRVGVFSHLFVAHRKN